jgi:hypothetical protein
MAEKSALTEALRSEIEKLAKEGDTKKDGTLTPEVLARIARVAKTGRELLVALDASPSNLSQMVKRGNGQFMGNSDSMADSDGAESGLSISSAQFAYPLAYSSPQENFGMVAIRELFAMAKNHLNGTTPAKLVEALAIAKEKGLTDVAAELEKQLGIGKDKPVLQPASDTEKKKED